LTTSEKKTKKPNPKPILLQGSAAPLPFLWFFGQNQRPHTQPNQPSPFPPFSLIFKAETREHKTRPLPRSPQDCSPCSSSSLLADRLSRPKTKRQRLHFPSNPQPIFSLFPSSLHFLTISLAAPTPAFTQRHFPSPEQSAEQPPSVATTQQPHLSSANRSLPLPPPELQRPQTHILHCRSQWRPNTSSSAVLLPSLGRPSLQQRHHSLVCSFLPRSTWSRGEEEEDDRRRPLCSEADPTVTDPKEPYLRKIKPKETVACVFVFCR